MKFLTLEKTFKAELEEKKSRFIAHLVPIHLFDELLIELRQEHKKASHHVSAFREISETNQINESAKDDGEPAGTSGMPVLKTLIGANLINTGVIVTRYFGGTKLGTGGLARAYAGAASLAIEQANLIKWQRTVQYQFQASFALSSGIERQIKLCNLTVLDRQFVEDGVVFTLEGAEENIILFKEAYS